MGGTKMGIILKAWLLFGLMSPVALARDEETPVQLADVPAVVQQAIKERVGDGRIAEITKSVTDGEITYDAEIAKKGRTRTFTFSTEGQLLEQEMFLAELPAAVRQAVHAHVGKGVIDGIYKEFDAGEVTYSVDMTANGKARDFTLSPSGKLLEMQMFVEELPAPVRDAIKRHAASGPCGDIYKCVDEDETSYEVDVGTGPKTRTLSFSPEGELLSEEQELSPREAPPAVQNTLGKHLAGAKLVALTRVVEDGETSFEAELRRAGKTENLVFDINGKLLPAD